MMLLVERKKPCNMLWLVKTWYLFSLFALKKPRQLLLRMHMLKVGTLLKYWVDIIVMGETNWSGWRSSFRTSASEAFGLWPLCWCLRQSFGQATKRLASTSPEWVGYYCHDSTLFLDMISVTMTSTNPSFAGRPCSWLWGVFSRDKPTCCTGREGQPHDLKPTAKDGSKGTVIL